jgi:hypothetical protein
MTLQGTPAFYGLVQCDNRQWGFQFWYPDGWHRFTFPAKRSGVIFGPLAENADTSFSVEVKKLKLKVSGEDLPSLYEGFMEGLQTLPNFKLEWQDKWVVAALTGLEAKYTFTENGQTRKRWIRLLYEGDRQFHVVAQGATPADYAYWEPMLFECMMTLTID